MWAITYSKLKANLKPVMDQVCKNRKIRLFSIFILISLAFSLTFPISAMGKKSAEPSIHFDKAKNTLSVRLTDAKLADIAETLSKDAGIKVFLDKSITRTITSSFQNEPLESGVKRLLGPDISSAFIFVKENNPSGEVIYRLDTVKIFNKGNLLSADFAKFDKEAHEEKDNMSSKTSEPSHSKEHRPMTPAEIDHEIMMARKNLDMLNIKNRIETDRVQKRILELNMKLSRNPSPEKRVLLVKELNQAQQSLGMVKSLNSRLIMDEENNVKELIEDKINIENKERFTERQQHKP